MRICILGGYGNTGRLIAQKLLQHSDAEILIAGRDIARAREMTEELQWDHPGKSISPLRMDAADYESLLRGLNGTDWLVVASSTAIYTGTIARAALDTESDYYDLQYSLEKLEVLAGMEEEIRQRGRCFITDGGFHPGLPGAMIRYAASNVRDLHRALVGSVIQIEWRQYGFSGATVEEMVRELSAFLSLEYRDGDWRRVSWLKPRRFDFHGEFGVQPTFPMMLEELRSLPEQIPTLRHAGFYVGGFNWFVDYLFMPVLWLLLKIRPQGWTKPMGRLLEWGLKSFSSPPYGTRLQLEASGRGENYRLRIAHQDGYLLTAIPVVACLLQIMQDSIRTPGLWYQAQIVDPDRLIEDMEEMGIRVERRHHRQEQQKEVL